MKKMKTAFLVFGLCFLGLSSNSWGEQSMSTLDEIKHRGKLKCGVTEGLLGFSLMDNATSTWSGLDVDFCRAISAAVFGNADMVEYVPLTGQKRFEALRNKEIDLLSRVTTRTLRRDTAEGVNFAPVTFYDGQGFMVHRDGANTLSELDNKTICVLSGTTTIKNLESYFAANNMTLNLHAMEHRKDLFDDFLQKKCDAFTDDASALASQKQNAGQSGAGLRILSERISKEPLAPVVRHGDDQWFDIVSWVVYATIEAEELNITSQNVAMFQMRTDNSPAVSYLLGQEGENGALLGLTNSWASNIISMVGNYGEIFERNVGTEGLGLERGLNDLWGRGGLMYAPPVR